MPIYCGFMLKIAFWNTIYRGCLLGEFLSFFDHLAYLEALPNTPPNQVQDDDFLAVKPPDKAIIIDMFELVHHSVGRNHRTPIFCGKPIHKFGRKYANFRILGEVAVQDLVYSLDRWEFHIANRLSMVQNAMTAFSGFHSFTSHSDKHLTMYV